MSSRYLRAAVSGAAWEEVLGWLCSPGGLQGGGEQHRASPGDHPCGNEKGTKQSLMKSKDKGKRSGKAGLRRQGL